MKNAKSFTVLLAAFLFPVLALAQNGDLGEIDFPTSGSPEAQKYFIKGVLLLHSFEYEDAADEFREAQERDPDFAMAYWGEAMTHNHPIWMQVNTEKARAVLNRLAPDAEARLAKAPTAREKAYLRSVEILYSEGDKLARDRAYAEAMRRLCEQYPDDLEAVAFHALALLGTCHEGRDFATYMQAAAVAEQVFQKNPKHPGAAHYLIHSYDDPIHAPLGLPMARVYAKIAPAAAHALHMPSHIFFAMGMWDEAVASNEDSWAAAEARRERKSLPLQQRGYHALLWREYAYLQQGRYQEAKAMFAVIAQDAKKSEHRTIRYHFAAMRAAYVVNTRLWNSEAARLEVKTEDLEKDAIAGDLFVRGMCAVETGDLPKAEKILAEIEALRPAKVTPTVSTTVGMQCHALPAESANYPPAVQAVNIMAKELRALIQMSEGKTDEALQLLKATAYDEDRMSFDFGPPVVVKPARELLGEMLLKLGRAQEAQAEFASSLKRAPKRFLSLLGMARAAAKAGDPVAAQEAYATLEKVLHRADAEMVELAEVKKGMTKRL